ncbi:MAG: ABC transporter substrate-binding protein [Bacteroidales bacterium]|nr:ABC transporter substrate-binding protein [Candidatus Latescibacterota bacterium]
MASIALSIHRFIDRRLVSFLFPALFLVVATFAGSCSREVQLPVVRLALQTEPTTADPSFAVDVSSGMLVSLTHQNLVRFDDDGKIAPDLAESWELYPDGLTYVFKLGRSGFSDGSPVKASDVVFSLRRLLDPETMSPRWWVLEPVLRAKEYHSGGLFDETSINAPDDVMVVIRLERPTAHFLSLLSMPAAAIVSREMVAVAGKEYGRTPGGSGPWKLKRWSAGDELILERNIYSSVKNVDVDGISLRIIPEPMTRIAEFEIGNIDILEVPRAELERWKSAGPTLMEREELSVVYIGLNNSRPPFDDPRVRRAMNMAIDVETIIARVLFGAGRKARGSIPPGLKGGSRGSDLYPYDPEKAASLLAEAGYPEGFEMEIWQRENPEAGRILESVQAYLSRVGIKVKIVTREWGAFKQAVDHGSPDAFYLDWYADYPDAENFLMPLFHSSNRGGGGNRALFSDSSVDSLLDAASSLADAEKRLLLYLDIEKSVYSDAPWIFLWFPIRYEVVSHRLKGYNMPVIFNSRRFTGISIR